jgi:ABC-type transporter Mla maintaining outer membrane lipid asymmetry ATPase subunit MlaF
MIDLRDLALDASDGRLLLEGLNLSVPRGGKQLVTGPSGSGKSRLLKVMAGTERPARGQVRVGGWDIWPGDGALSLQGQVRTGFAFQAGGLLSNLSLRENIALPLRFSGVLADDTHVRTEAAIDFLGLHAVADLRPHAVSASARKHGNLARVLAMDPDLILLDDPLDGLDVEDRAAVLAVLGRWALDATKTVVLAQEEAGVSTSWATGHLDLHATFIPLEMP